MSNFCEVPPNPTALRSRRNTRAWQQTAAFCLAGSLCTASMPQSAFQKGKTQFFHHRVICEEDNMMMDSQRDPRSSSYLHVLRQIQTPESYFKTFFFFSRAIFKNLLFPAF